MDLLNSDKAGREVVKKKFGPGFSFPVSGIAEILRMACRKTF